MRATFRWVGLVVVIVGIAVGSLTLGARYYDGPISVFTGGPFKSGEITPAPNDWNSLRDRDTVQFQTLNPATARTIWFVVHDRRLFFTSGYLKWDEDHGLAEYGLPGLMAKLTKRWPYQLENDDRIILRIDEKLYEQRLQPVTSGPDIVPVLDEFGRKYGDGMGIGAAEVTEGYTRMYEVVDR